MKKYNISTEEQKIYENIIQEIEAYKNNINEKLITENVVDILKKYAKKGLLTTAVLSSLLNNNIATASDLINAGIPKNEISQITSGSHTDDEIFNKLITTLKTRGYQNDEKTLNSILKLNDNDKKTIINTIRKNIKDLNDIKDFKYNIITTDREDYGDKNKFIQKLTPNTQVIVDTIVGDVDVSGLEKYFKNNSANIIDDNELVDSLKSVFDVFQQITQIEIKTSSNTLRNTGDFENMTWYEGSMARGNSLKNLISDISYSLGGNNETKKIDPNIIKIDAHGENGDGTSGPKSPYEVSKNHIDSYRQRNIDEKFWKSNAKGTPYTNIQDYLKHNNVTINIKGLVIDENPYFVKSYNYFHMVQEKKIKGRGLQLKINIHGERGNKIKKGKHKAVSCPDLFNNRK